MYVVCLEASKNFFGTLTLKWRTNVKKKTTKTLPHKTDEKKTAVR